MSQISYMMKPQYYLHADFVLPRVFRSLLYQLRAHANLFGLIVPIMFGKVTNYECPHTEELSPWKVLASMLARAVKYLKSVRNILIRISAATPS
jgi:hypothetical protein